MPRHQVFVFYEQNLLSSLDDSSREMDRARRGAPRLARERLRRPARRGAAERPERARAATRRARGADEGAELHYGLVVPAGIARGDERPRERADPRDSRGRLRVEPQAVEAAEDAHDVAVHDGLGDVERDRGDRRRRVGADARERAQALERARERARGRDRPGGPVEIARARVVAEAAPLGEDVALRCAGERRRPRETASGSVPSAASRPRPSSAGASPRRARPDTGPASCATAGSAGSSGTSAQGGASRRVGPSPRAAV